MAQVLPTARESVPYYFTMALAPEQLAGAVDITGWTFKLALTRQMGGTPDISLAMATTGLGQGFAIASGAGLLLTIRILTATLTGIADTTGCFQLFGDLLAEPPGGDPFLVADLILPVTKGPTSA